MDDQRVGTGKLLHDEVVAARSGGAWLVEMGQRIRITDIEGAAIGPPTSRSDLRDVTGRRAAGQPLT